MDAYWRAANYLSAGQIYLHDNPSLKKPLTLEHIKLRLLGHWRTTPGLNFLYVHLNRVNKDPRSKLAVYSIEKQSHLSSGNPRSKIREIVSYIKHQRGSDHKSKSGKDQTFVWGRVISCKRTNA